MVQQPLVGQGLPIIEDSLSHSDTLWTRDQPDAETSTSQHTTLVRDKIPLPGGIRTHNPSKRGAADPRSRECGIIFSLDLEKIFHQLALLITTTHVCSSSVFKRYGNG